MALKFFYVYIGVFLACSVTMAVVVKQLAAGFAASGKKPYVYGLVSSVAASGVAWLSTLISNNLFTVYWLLAGIYFLFGLAHIVLVHKKYFHSDRQNDNKVIAGEIIFGLAIICFTIVVFSSLQYFIAKDRAFLFYPILTSTIAFFIPFLFMKTFESAYNIPPAVFKTWQYPLHREIDVPDEKPGEKVLVIGFEIAKTALGKKRTYFRAKAPDGMMLGELYYHFINDYNEAESETPIGYADNDYDPHVWWFRKKPRWFQLSRILDPERSIRENGIKENTVIICERISNGHQS
jgi:phosphatidylglycerophosphatase A